MGRSSIYIRCPSDVLPMQDSREIDYFGQRILQIVQPIAAGGDRGEVLALLAQSVADNFAADACWVLQYVSPGVVRLAATACVNHRANTISNQLTTCKIPTAPTPVLWRMPLLPDYQVMVVETRDRDRVTGCLIVATKGVQWYRETKLVLQIVAEYVSTALIEEDLQVQARISQIYPQLHYRLTQAIVENQQIDRLFEIAVSDMVEALNLKRGLVLTLKAGDRSSSRDAARTTVTADPVPANNTNSNSTTFNPRASTTAVQSLALTKYTGDRKNTQVQIVTTIDVRKGNLLSVPSSFALEDSRLCQLAIANAPNPTIFDRQARTTATDRLIFQDDRLSSIAMIPLMGATSPDRPASDALWGWLVLQHDKSRHWHPVELKLLQCQIYQIALARIQSTSLKHARNAIANRTSQVQNSLQLQTKLHDAGRKRMEKLRQANELKDEFISTISHELRTPLTSMSLAIKMLRQADVDPVRREQYLDILEEQCQREIKLVNDLLKLQQLESKQLELRPQTISLDRFVGEQARFGADRWSESKELKLALHLPKRSLQMETDADNLKHILEELLVNAGKFALPQTTIDVWLTIVAEQAIFEITNLSRPIADEDLPHLFDRFRRGSGITQQAIAGTGLGLALVKSMVEHSQGTIEVASDGLEPGIAKISFTVTIPTTLERH
jgi:signal transduction histidine kinase